jgi:hypothetical protein
MVVNSVLNLQFSYTGGNLLTTRQIASRWRRVVVACHIKSVDCSLSVHCSGESVDDHRVLKTEMFLLYAYTECIESALTLY